MHNFSLIIDVLKENWKKNLLEHTAQVINLYKYNN